MTAETREDLALKVLQAFADIENTTSLECGAHLERISGYTRKEKDAMVEELFKLGYLADEAFNHGILKDGITCLDRGYVFDDSVLAARRNSETEERRHNDVVVLQKEANRLTGQANDSAERSAKAAEDSARRARIANIISWGALLVAFVSLLATVFKNQFNDHENTTYTSNRCHCENNALDKLIVDTDELTVHIQN